LYFCTISQAIIHGYGGLRIREDGLRVRPQLLSNTNKLALHGLFYLGQRLDVVREGNNVSFSIQQQQQQQQQDLLQKPYNDVQLQVRDDANGALYDMPCSFTVEGNARSWTVIPST
jgi:trehalose/maltose hydrolase-like predicted phosphorylase